MELNSTVKITTTEMHTGGEPLRIVESGFPEPEGATILEKRRYVRENMDHLRRLIIYEPRGHYDMYGAILVKPDIAGADFGVLFMHNEGYSTMCGHAVIALARYAVDQGLVKTITEPETKVSIQCPCGLVTAYNEVSGGKSGATRFHSVPAFASALDVSVDVPKYGNITVDIGYGGAFYALVPGDALGVDVRKSRTQDIVDAADAVSEAVRASVKLSHPDNEDLAFLYGTIVTDGKDAYSVDVPTANVCVFANREVDRCPTGSGVTARIAVQFARKLIEVGQKRTFVSGANESTMKGSIVEKTHCGVFDAVIVEVSGRGFYSGSATFTVEDDDDLKAGFLLR